MDRQFVVVSGPPGAGKTTVAEPLAEGLGFPLVSKDSLKEAIWDALGPPAGHLGWSRRTGAAAMEALWAIAARSSAVVLEANFRPLSSYERQRLTDLGGRLVEVYCACPPTVAAHRYRVRAESPAHHPAHVGRTVTADTLAEYSRPLAIGPVITLDTTDFVDVWRLVQQVRSALRTPWS